MGKRLAGIRGLRRGGPVLVAALAVVQSVPPVGHPGADLGAVSCLPGGACTAVGYREGTSGEGPGTAPLAMRWDGTKWHTQMPAGAGGLQGFTGVSYPSATACIAIGGTYGQRWKGRTWALQPIPVPAGAQGFSLTAVSCTSARACTAVGSKNLTPSLVTKVLTVAERWNGHRWVLQATPSPKPA
jgi:hypothetical protein